jgi:hypothetical protein
VRRTTNASSRNRIVAFVAAAIGVALVIVLLIVFSGSDKLHSPDPKDGPGPKSLEVPSAAADEISPITATTLGSSSAPVLGTDERWHVVYELQLTNVRPQLSTVESVDVLDARNESRVVETFSGADLQRRLRTLGSRPTTSLVLEPNAARLMLIELAFDRRKDVPSALVHRFQVLTAPIGGSAPAQPAYTAATILLDGGAAVVGPPLIGGGWVDGNGCC